MFPSVQQLDSNKKNVETIYQEFQGYLQKLLEISKMYHQRLGLSFTAAIKTLKKIVDEQYVMPSSIKKDVNICMEEFSKLNGECTLELIAEVQVIYNNFKHRLQNYLKEHAVPDVLEVIINEIWQSVSLTFDVFNQNTLENTSRAMDALGTTITTAGFITAGISIGGLAFTVASAATRVGVSFYAAMEGLSTGAITIGTRAISLLLGGTMGGALVAIVGIVYMVHKYHSTKSNAKMVLQDMSDKQTILMQEALEGSSLINQNLNTVLDEYTTRTGAMLKTMEKHLDRDLVPFMIKVTKVKDMIMELPKFKE
jgi:hypothetical protein